MFLNKYINNDIIQNKLINYVLFSHMLLSQETHTFSIRIRSGLHLD